jgi:TetR/AcrR family fatty acid metabolism transcriptional regulator
VRVRSPFCAGKILDAAGRLFGTRRFHEVRMEDIAAEAGVGKGTLYRYFQDKEELYLKLLERASVDFTQRVHDAVRQVAGVRDRLVALVRTIIAYHDEQPHILELIQRAELLRGLGADFPWQAARNDLFHLATELLETGRARGEFVVRDPETTMLLLMGGLRGIIRFGKRPRPEGVAEQVVDALLGPGAGTDLSSHLAIPAEAPGEHRSTNGVHRNAAGADR